MFQFTSCCQVVLWIHMRKRVDPDHCGWLYSEYSHTLPCAYLSNQTRLHMNHNEFQIKSLLSCQIPPRMLSLQSQVPSVLTLYAPRPPVSVPTMGHTLNSRVVSMVTRYCINSPLFQDRASGSANLRSRKFASLSSRISAQAVSPRTSGLLLRPHWTCICVTRTQEYKSSWYGLLSSVSAWASILPSKGSY